MILDKIGLSPREVVGIGLRGPHLREIMTHRPAIGWLEVHAENYFANAPARMVLGELRCDYPVSLHGVGLSLGSAEGLSTRHLSQLQALVHEIEPARVSEHLSFSTIGGAYLNDLLPLPYTEEALAVVARNVAATQEALGRAVLVENPSAYLRYRHATISEPEFLGELCRRTGCGVLCDVNNAYVCAENFGLDARAWLGALPAAAVAEIHLAGHHRDERNGRALLIDDHGSAVTAEVWALYEASLHRFGAVATLIEWDKNLPPLATLLGEAEIARTRLAATLEAGDAVAA